jgi:hypothetical protein
MRSRFATQAMFALLILCATQLLAENPQNPGVLQKYTARASSRLRFLASDAGKEMLLHSPNPVALTLLKRFHPDAVGQYPKQPLYQVEQTGGARRPPLTVTGCGTNWGTVMNLEPSANAVSQSQPSVDFLLSELGSGSDLVVETGADDRGLFGTLDSETGVYVHRDPTVSCYGGSDFEMGNPVLANPLSPGDFLPSVGSARVLADDNPAHKQILLVDNRLDEIASGIGLRRVPTANLESTTTCPQGTLTGTQEATCIGTTGILVDASLDDVSDTPVIAQDPRSSGTGAGDIYIVNPSLRVLRSVMLLTACKATFMTTSDCSTPLIVSGAEDGTVAPSVAVVGGGPNAGTIAITWLYGENIIFVTCTPQGAPAQPVCGNHTYAATDPYMIGLLTDNPYEFDPWPVLAARTDSAGQTFFVVWSTCKAAPEFPLIACPDADVVMSVNTSISSPSWAFHHVNTATGHQFLPSIAYDSGQGIINIAYYSTSSAYYKNQVVMQMNQIAPGTITIGATTNITTSYDSLEGDGTVLSTFSNPIGDFTGLAAHGGSASGSSRLYMGFTNNTRLGTYGTATNTQADNNVSRVTY